jgi:hypothetical protein
VGLRLLVATLLVAGLASSSWATSLSDFAVFAGGNLYTGLSLWDGSAVTGQVGSNSNVFAESSTLNGSVVGGGDFGTGGGNRILGDMRFNGSITLDTAGGDWVAGHIYSSGYSAVALPSTMYPEPGNLPVSSGSLSDATLTLSAGRYRYDFIAGTLNLQLDPSQGSIDVYVDGGVWLDSASVSIWDGQQYVPYAQAVADPALRALAQNVFFETGGSWAMTSGEWFGRIYAPNGGVSIGALPGTDVIRAVDITGAVWAGQDVTLGVNSKVNVIPEPITALGLVLGGLAAMVRRHRK